ncbi:MAG: DNRLRE domain-containing protein [Phycisphaerae bacterium]|nr:DNRLRE domain-containing protein [Phycisphaerae bacterium]
MAPCSQTPRCLLAMLVVLVCSPALGSTTITLQQGLNGYTGTTDAWLDESLGRRNYGGDPELLVKWNNGYSDDTVIKFDLTGRIPPNQRILSATLSFWYSREESMQDDNAITISVYRIDPTKWWDENIHIGESGEGVSWRYRDINELYTWTSEAGAWWDKINDGNGTNKIKRTGGTVPDAIEPQHWVPFSVTASVQNWYGGAGNTGFLVVATGFVGGGTTATGIFTSRNDSLSAYRPKLTITYEGALLPVADADGPYSVGPGESIIFDGSGSYDPDGGNIVSWAWDLDNDGQYDDASGEYAEVTYDYLVNTLGLEPGMHVIGLRVVDDEDESDTDTANLEIRHEVDLGDARDPSYPTLLASNGARHLIEPGYYMGLGVDGELDGQPDPNALGDDNDGNDDEDGVVFQTVLMPGRLATVEVTVSAEGRLDAWIDFNNDGSWVQPSDQIFLSRIVYAGVSSLDFAVPATATPNVTTVSRFRFSSLGGLPFEGEAPNGEVEDHQVEILAETFDFGDAEDPTYPTLLASDGARHLIIPGIYMGLGVDDEPDGQPDPNALGDDNDGNDDEDGVVFTSSLIPGHAADVDVSVSVDGRVDAWLDFNDDGSWAEPDDQIFVSEPVFAGANVLHFTVPASATPNITTVARFRFSIDGGLPFIGEAPTGEVEDHEVAISEEPPPMYVKWQQEPHDSGDGFDAASDLWWNEGQPGEEVNKVVADDFISDGRPIEAMMWWGSYLDGQYAPEHVPVEPYILDGWIISFHHVDPGATCPPEPAPTDVPTVLGVYFAPVGAVQIDPLFMVDCFEHNVYMYRVNLEACCLLCAEVDPRPEADPPIPAEPGVFRETAGLGYWLDIQAVVGVTWNPSAGCTYDDRMLTGHLPSPVEPEGHFWGWHTSRDNKLGKACTGRIIDFTPYPPDCWDYGEWVDQPWLCPNEPQPVQMAFNLLTPEACACLGDVNINGRVDGLDVQGFVECLVGGNPPGINCACADLDDSGWPDVGDIPLFVAELLDTTVCW